MNLFSILLFPALSSGIALASTDYAILFVHDAATMEGVPGIQLRISDGQEFTTDDHGLVSFYEPGWMNKDVWFEVVSDDYEAPKTGKVRGMRFNVEADSFHLIPVDRVGESAVPSGDEWHLERITRGVVGPSDFTQITVVDSQTGRGVPLMDVHTPSQRFVTDSQGVAAVFDPDHIGEEVELTIEGQYVLSSPSCASAYACI